MQTHQGTLLPGWVTLTIRLNPAIVSTSTGVVPIMSPVPRRDSLEMRGRAGSNTTTSGVALNGETHGLERVIESLKIENADARKGLRELDDRCISHF